MLLLQAMLSRSGFNLTFVEKDGKGKKQSKTSNMAAGSCKRAKVKGPRNRSQSFPNSVRKSKIKTGGTAERGKWEKKARWQEKAERRKAVTSPARNERERKVFRGIGYF